MTTAVASKTLYLRIGELAERAGVTVATIKYYIREGVLPPPPVKTGRTMGYYDLPYLERLMLVRRLREDHYLPLRVIRAVLVEHGDKPLGADEAAVLARVGGAVAGKLDPTPPDPTPTPGAGGRLSRAEVAARTGAPPEELDLLEQMGLAGERAPGAAEATYGEADLALLDAMTRAERAGLSRALFPIEGLGHYVELLGELARREIRLFLRHASASVPPAELAALAERAVEVTEPVIAAIRRKLIARALRAELSRHPREESP